MNSIVVMHAQARLRSSARMSKTRGYQSITPANNMVLKKKWDQCRFDMHRMKVQDAKPMIDNKSPKIYSHLHLKLKKRQVEEERRTAIQRDNKILLEKMSAIMNTQSKVNETFTTDSYHKRSLNRTRREHDLLRVTRENQAILKRIQSKESHYKHCKHHGQQSFDQQKANKGHIPNISRHHHTRLCKEKLEQMKFINSESNMTPLQASTDIETQRSSEDLFRPVTA